MAQLTDYDRALRASRPVWFPWLYRAAVVVGLCGGVLLLLRSAKAQPVFVVSLLLVLAWSAIA